MVLKTILGLKTVEETRQFQKWRNEEVHKFVNEPRYVAVGIAKISFHIS
jgi:hypothetical protein